MKIVLSTLNAKYIHSSLALLYLREVCQCPDWSIVLKEFTINETLDSIMSDIYAASPDILCFSCYIWNIEPILAICEDYKKVAPYCLIILGGPEVSYDAADILESHSCIDAVVQGEGERTLPELLSTIYHKQAWDGVRGITYRGNRGIIENPERELIKDLDFIPSPYQGSLDYYRNRSLYYESSRGCPFSCSYCLSSTRKGVRFFSMERVKQDLQLLMDQGIRDIRFVDRTFNIDEKRALEIIQFIIDQNKASKFHFEIGAELMSDQFIDFLDQVPAGVFSFEIGVQSTCMEALEAVDRRCNWDRMRNNITRLQANGKINIHLDLIAGLPCEDFCSFAVSFNDVYALRPDVIQLGFLKMLKGAKVRSQIDEYGYIFTSRPPYQVLSNRFITYAEITKLTRIEELVGKYYNSGHMKNALSYLVEQAYGQDAFKFYEEFAGYWQAQGYFNQGHKKEAEFGFLQEFVVNRHVAHSQAIGEWLKFDYLLNNRHYKLPPIIVSHNAPGNAGQLNTVIKDTGFLSEKLPGMLNHNPGEIMRQVHLENLYIDPVTYKLQNFLHPLLFIYQPGGQKAMEIIDMIDYLPLNQ